MQRNTEKAGKTKLLDCIRDDYGWQDNFVEVTVKMLKRIDAEAKNVKAFLLSLVWQLDNYERSYAEKHYYPAIKPDTQFSYDVKFAGFDVRFHGWCPQETNQEDYVMYVLTRRLKGMLKNVLDKLGDNKYIKDAIEYEWYVKTLGY